MNQQDLKSIVIVEKPDLLFEDLNGNKIRLISAEDETYLENSYKSMIEYMRDNHSQELSEEEKDTMYLDLQRIWNEVSGKNGGRLNEISFNLILHKNECKYLLNLVKTKLEYDVDSVFYAMELNNMIEKMVESGEFTDDGTGVPFEMSAVDIHYLYQIISKHKVKGLTKNSYYFAEILKRIALSSKVFNYYKENFTNIAKSLQLWVASLDKGFAIKEDDKVYQLIWGNSDTKPVFNISKDPKETKEVKKTKEVNTES